MAATGALLGVKCYPSQAEALDSFYSNIASVQSPGVTSYVIQYSKVASTWNQNSYSIDAAGVWTLRSSTAAPVVDFPACDPTETFMDGMAIGWSVVAALVTVGAFKLMEKATS